MSINKNHIRAHTYLQVIVHAQYYAITRPTSGYVLYCIYDRKQTNIAEQGKIKKKGYTYKKEFV